MGAYLLSRAAATRMANYLSTYQSDNKDARELASGLFALVNQDEDRIVIIEDLSPILKPTNKLTKGQSDVGTPRKHAWARGNPICLVCGAPKSEDAPPFCEVSDC